jgi:hypothetical protein
MTLGVRRSSDSPTTYFWNHFTNCDIPRGSAGQVIADLRNKIIDVNQDYDLPAVKTGGRTLPH